MVYHLNFLVWKWSEIATQFFFFLLILPWSTLLWHRCYYPHWSRDALSSVCGIFFKLDRLSFRPRGQDMPYHTKFSFISELTFRGHQVDMDGLNPEFALYGFKNECARTDTIFFPLSEVSTRAVTLSSILSQSLY